MQYFSIVLLPLLLTFIQTSVSKPLHTSHTVLVHNTTTLQSREEPIHYTPSPVNLLGSHHQSLGDEEHNTAIAPRGKSGISVMNCKLLARHQQSAILPTVIGAAALKGFWQIVAMKALYSDAFKDPHRALFTITEGALQATFSCLGQPVPWDFVQNFAMMAAQSVESGWLEAFDVIYEQELVGITIWVSLRILDKGTRKRKAGT